MRKFKKIFAFVMAFFISFTSIASGVFAQSHSSLEVIESHEPKFLQSEGGKINFTLKGTDLLDAELIAIVMENSDSAEDIKEISDTLEDVEKVSNSKRIVSITFPKNTTEKAKKYKVNFKIKGQEHLNASMNSVEVRVLKNTNPNPSIPNVPNPEDKALLNSVAISGNSDDNPLKLSFKLTGENFKANNIKVKVMENSTRKTDIENTLDKSLTSPKSSFPTLVFPKNTTNTDIRYRVYFNVDGSDVFEEKNSVEVVITPQQSDNNTNPPAIEELVASTNVSSKEFSDEGGTLEFELITKKKIEAGKIKVNVTLNGEKIDLGNSATVSGDSFKHNVSLTFPRNNTKNENVYKLTFNATGSTENFQSQPEVVVKVAPSKSNVVINELIALTPKLQKEGGIAKVSVKGENLTKVTLELKVFKVENGMEVEKSEISSTASFSGVDKIQTATLNFPHSNGNIDTYKVKVGLNGNLSHEVIIVVGENESGTKTGLYPTNVSIDKESKVITLRFNEEIFLASNLKNLKKGISLDIEGNGNYKQLVAEDTVELQENSKIVITLKDKVSINAKSKIKFNERILKDSNNRESEAFDYFINKTAPIIDSATFLEGEILDYKGGKAVVKLSGENLNMLNNSNTNLVLVRVEKVEMASEQSTLINSTVDYKDDKNILITFNLPENTSKHTESYIVKVSTDAGSLFLSDYASNVFANRSKRVVSSVLPKGIDKDKATISFVSIQSYGTSGGNTEVPNNTHTNLPIGQESKKTWVYVYGTNLKSDLTTVKIIDANNVVWYPIRHEGTSDSMDNFIMVNFDGTGVLGNGNNQMLEIICPRNIKGDNTYKFLVSADGVNYNEEVFVTATVLDDGEPSKLNLTKDEIREITVSHEDKDGVKLQESSVLKGYTWSKLKSFNMNPVSISGYKAVGYKLNDESTVKEITKIHEEKVANNSKVTYIYEKSVETNDDNVIVHGPTNTKIVAEKGRNFKDLKVDVTKIDKNTVNSLKDKDAEIFDINFSDTLNNVTLTDGLYHVTVEKQSNKEVVEVYHVTDNGDLEKLPFKDNGNTVTFTTTHFSKFAIVYKASSYIVIPPFTSNTNNNIKPNDDNGGKKDDTGYDDKNKNVVEEVKDDTKNKDNKNKNKVTKSKNVDNKDVKKQKLPKTNLTTASSLIVTGLFAIGLAYSHKKRR